MPQPTSNPRLAYRIKSGDNSLTVPGRVTFPKGTFVPKPPTSNYYNSERYSTPYQQGSGTMASGMNGFQGTPFAMAPVNNNAPVYGQSQTRTGYGVPASFYSRNLPIQTGQQAAQQWQTNQRLYRGGATDDSWYSPVQQQPIAPQPVAPPLGPGQFVNTQGQVQQGATPFGTDAFGNRLDASGNVWDPATATTDIYGGKFIQEGTVKWARNRAGRLIKVKYGSGGNKRVISGGKGQAKRRHAREAAAAAEAVQPVVEQQVTPPVQNVVPQPSIANAFVSFRA